MPMVLLKSPPAGVPSQVEVTGEAKIGGEGAVYFSRDGQFAVEVYHQPRPDKEQLLEQVMQLFGALPPEQERFILPPLALVESVDGQWRVGFVMRCVPPHYRELLEFILNPKVAARQFQEGKSCRQHFPYPYWLSPAPRRACPFCGERVSPPFPAVLELYEERQKHNFVAVNRRVVLGHGFKLFADVTTPGRKPPFTRRGEKSIGHVEWDERAQQYRLVNEEGGEWSARAPDGTQRLTARQGQSLPLSPGFFL